MVAFFFIQIAYYNDVLQIHKFDVPVDSLGILFEIDVDGYKMIITFRP